MSGPPPSDDGLVPEEAKKQAAEQIIHQHPLAYLLGLEGIALLRAFAGEHGRVFTEARFAEVRRLLEQADDLGPGVDVGATAPRRRLRRLGADLLR
jgi:hypothetical protein